MELVYFFTSFIFILILFVNSQTKFIYQYPLNCDTTSSSILPSFFILGVLWYHPSQSFHNLASTLLNTYIFFHFLDALFVILCYVRQFKFFSLPHNYICLPSPPTISIAVFVDAQLLQINFVGTYLNPQIAFSHFHTFSLLVGDCQRILIMSNRKIYIIKGSLFLFILWVNNSNLLLKNKKSQLVSLLLQVQMSSLFLTSENFS